MAVIGRYQRTQTLQPYQGPTVGFENRITPAQQRFAGTLEGIAKEAFETMQTVVEQRDDAEALNLANTYKQRDREFMAEQFKKKGADGIRVYDDAKKYFDRNLAEAHTALETPDKIKKFNSLYFPSMDSRLNSAIAYQNEQIDLFQKSSWAAQAEQATADAIQSRFNEAEVERNRKIISQSVGDLNKHLGPEAAANEIYKAESAMYDKVIRAMAIENPYRAKLYYDKVQTAGTRPAIEGETAAELEKMLKTTTMRQEAQRNADIIMKSAETPAEQRAKARAIEDPEVRSATETMVNAYIDQAEEEARQQKLQYESDMIGKIRDAGTLAAALDSIKGVADGKTYVELEKIAQSLYKPKEIVSDKKVFENYWRMIDYGQIANKEQLMKAYPHLDDADRKALEAHYVKGGPLAQLTEAKVSSLYKAVTGQKESKIDPAVFYDIYKYVRQRAPLERNATDDEIMDFIADGVMAGEVELPKTSFWSYIRPDENLTWYEAVKQGKTEYWMPELSDTERQEMIDWLKQNSFMVNERNIANAWKMIRLGWSYPEGILGKKQKEVK